MDQLIDTVSKVAAKDGTIAPLDLYILRQRLGGAERVRILAGSGDLGLGSWKPSFDRLFSESRKALETGAFTAPDEVRQQVGALIVALRFSCSSAAGKSRSTTPSVGTERTGQKKPENLRGYLLRELDRHVGLILDLGYSNRLLLMVLGLMFMATGMIWVGHWIVQSLLERFYEKLFPSPAPVEEPDSPAGLYNQYECRIHAALELGLDVVDGSIVALDQISAQFQPVNEGALERIRGLLDQEEASLVIGPCRLSVKLPTLSQGTVSGLFETALDDDVLKNLLDASVEDVQFSRPPIAELKTNIKISNGF